MDVSPIDQATSILGEHYKNYVVIFQEDTNPTSYDIRYSDPYAAKGLLDLCVKYHTSYLEGDDIFDSEIEWVEEEDDEGEDYFY